MDLTSGYPYSLIRYGLPFNYPVLTADMKTDVVIIGGGISGALMAYYLVKKNISCILIDKRTIGLGSTSASTSLLQYEIDVPLFKLRNAIGLKKAERAYDLCANAITELKKIAAIITLKEFHECNSLYFAHDESKDLYLKREYEARKEAGFDVKLLNKKAIRSGFGFDASSAILSASAAYTNAYVYTHKLLQYSILKGLKVFDRTDAKIINDNGTDVSITTGDGKKIKAKSLIYANGFEAINYIDKKIVDLKSTYVVCSEHMDPKNIPFKTDTLLWNTADPYMYIRATGDNRILIGGRDDDFYAPDKRSQQLNRKCNLLIKDFSKLFPATKFKKEFRWAGTFGSTVDGLPFIGKYKNDSNSYFALGFGGNGITFSLIAAEILSEMIIGNNAADSQLFSFDRTS